MADRSHVWPQRHRKRSELAARFFSDFRIRNCSGVAMRVTEIHSLLSGVVEFFGWSVISQVVAAIVSEPQFLRARIPTETHAVADAGGEDLDLCRLLRCKTELRLPPGRL